MDRLNKQRDRKQRCGKAVTTASRKTAAKPTQLHGDICNIWTEPSGKEKQEHLQDGKNQLLFSQQKTAVMCPGTNCKTAFWHALQWQQTVLLLAQRDRKKVVRGQEMASFLALPALRCLLFHVKVSGEPVSRMSLMLLPTFPPVVHSTQQQGKARKKSINVHLSHRQSNYRKAMPVQVQRNAHPFAALKLEGLRSPVLSQFPAWGQLLTQQSCLQNTPYLHTWESESLISLFTVWFLQTIHSMNATEGILPGDTNTGAWRTLTWSCLVCSDYQGYISSRGYKNSFPVTLLYLIQLTPLPSTQSRWLHMSES